MIVSGVWLWPQELAAYIDPGSGSMLFQMVLVAVLGAAFAIKLKGQQLVSKLKKIISTRLKKPRDGG